MATLDNRDYDNRAAFLPAHHAGAAQCATCGRVRLAWRVHRYTRLPVCDTCRAGVPYVALACVLDALHTGATREQALAELPGDWLLAVQIAGRLVEDRDPARLLDLPTQNPAWLFHHVARTPRMRLDADAPRERRERALDGESLLARGSVCGREEYARLVAYAGYLLVLHARRAREASERRSGGLMFARLPFRVRNGHTARMHRAFARAFRAGAMRRFSGRLVWRAHVNARLLSPRSRAWASVQASAPSMAPKRASKRTRKAASVQR